MRSKPRFCLYVVTVEANIDRITCVWRVDFITVAKSLT